MSVRSILGVAAAAFLFVADGTHAQTTQPQTLPPSQPGGPERIPEKTPSSPANSGASGNLSEKLDKSDGVIKPPSGVDPAMSKGAPNTPATMPVIKPMEEKGGPVAK